MHTVCGVCTANVLADCACKSLFPCRGKREGRQKNFVRVQSSFFLFVLKLRDSLTVNVVCFHTQRMRLLNIQSCFKEVVFLTEIAKTSPACLDRASTSRRAGRHDTSSFLNASVLKKESNVNYFVSHDFSRLF